MPEDGGIPIPASTHQNSPRTRSLGCEDAPLGRRQTSWNGRTPPPPLGQTGAIRPRTPIGRLAVAGRAKRGDRPDGSRSDELESVRLEGDGSAGVTREQRRRIGHRADDRAPAGPLDGSQAAETFGPIDASAKPRFAESRGRRGGSDAARAWPPLDRVDESSDEDASPVWGTRQAR
jgi:hypothetical protein